MAKLVGWEEWLENYWNQTIDRMTGESTAQSIGDSDHPGAILHGSTGYPIFSAWGGQILHADKKFEHVGVSYAGQLLWAWVWEGDDGAINAHLNGNNVCSRHSRSHLIPYSISGTGGYVEGTTVIRATCTAGWQRNPGWTDSEGNFHACALNSSVSIRCGATFFGEYKEINGSNSLTAIVTIDLDNKKWTLTAG